MHNSGNSMGSSSGGGATYGMTPEQASREFDLLRREATKLERHLEDRVARYQQVCRLVVTSPLLEWVSYGFVYMCVCVFAF